MKLFEWNDGKNYKLREERGISFEDIVYYIEKGDILDIIPHPQLDKYPGQKIFIVAIEDYAYLVPFIENADDPSPYSTEEFREYVSRSPFNNTGGIDLTLKRMDLQTTGSGEGITFNIDPAMLQKLQDAKGFVPVIMDIQPLNNLPEFLGVKMDDGPAFQKQAFFSKASPLGGKLVFSFPKVVNELRLRRYSSPSSILC